MAKLPQITLEEYCTQRGVTVIAREPASMVSPRYRNKPVDQQVKSGVRGVLEILLSDETTVYICDTDQLVFATAESTFSHRNSGHRAKAAPAKAGAGREVDRGHPSTLAPGSLRKPRSKAKTEEAAPEAPMVLPGRRVMVKQKSLQETRHKEDGEELTYGQLKRKLEELRQELEASWSHNAKREVEFQALAERVSVLTDSFVEAQRFAVESVGRRHDLLHEAFDTLTEVSRAAIGGHLSTGAHDKFVEITREIGGLLRADLETLINVKLTYPPSEPSTS